MTPEETHRRVRRLLWALLSFATTASVSGNITRAVAAHAGAAAVGPIVAAALAPVALLGLTHLLGLWSHIAARGATYWAFLIAIIVLAAAAFRLSFGALRDLAISYGYARFDAALFPLILDGLVAICTLGLVALTRIEVVAATQTVTRSYRGDAVVTHRETGHQAGDDARRDAADGSLRRGNSVRGSVDDAERHGAPAADAHPVVAQSHGALTEASIEADRMKDTRSSAENSATGGPQRKTAPAIALNGERTAEVPSVIQCDGPGTTTDSAVVTSPINAVLARRLIDSGRTTASVETVCAVLDHAAKGTSSRTIAEILHVSASSVQRIVKAAREVRSTGVA